VKLRRSVEEFDDIDMTPMIDIIFQLVIFFMVAASFVDTEFFAVEVPKADRPERVAAEDSFTVLVTGEGIIAPAGSTRAADRYESPTALYRDLERYARSSADAGRTPVVVVQGDRNANYQDVIHAWNAVRKAGIAQVSLQVAAP
jgi:biopolymer transport protein ExbD